MNNRWSSRRSRCSHHSRRRPNLRRNRSNLFPRLLSSCIRPNRHHNMWSRRLLLLCSTFPLPRMHRSKLDLHQNHTTYRCRSKHRLNGMPPKNNRCLNRRSHRPHYNRRRPNLRRNTRNCTPLFSCIRPNHRRSRHSRRPRLLCSSGLNRR